MAAVPDAEVPADVIPVDAADSAMEVPVAGCGSSSFCVAAAEMEMDCSAEADADVDVTMAVDAVDPTTPVCGSSFSSAAAAVSVPITADVAVDATIPVDAAIPADVSS